MNQQLAAIATGIADLPANIAKSLEHIPRPSATIEPPSSDAKSRIVPLPQLDRNEVSDKIGHWTPDRYLAMRKKGKDDDTSDIDGSAPGDSPKTSRREGKKSTLSCYMEDENGDPIPNTQRDAARARARSFWRKLFNQGVAPPKSGEADANITDEYIAFMEEGFPWLRYCENHWKSLQIWRNHYPSWHKDRMYEARRAKMEVDADVIDVDAGRSNDQVKKSKRRRMDDDEPLDSPGPAPTKRSKVCMLVFFDYFHH